MNKEDIFELKAFRKLAYAFLICMIFLMTISIMLLLSIMFEDDININSLFALISIKYAPINYLVEFVIGFTIYASVLFIKMIKEINAELKEKYNM